MKKLAIGCGIVVLLVFVAGGVGVYYIYSTARSYLKEFESLAELDKGIANESSFTAPASGELTPDMVKRYVAVQESMRARLGPRFSEIAAKQDEFMRREQAEHRQATPAENFIVIKDMMGYILEAKNAWVAAMNEQRFSIDEYDWVRRQVYAASGLTVSEMGLRTLSKTLQEGGTIVRPLEIDGGSVPARNKELVAPLVPRLKDWAPSFFFGF